MSSRSRSNANNKFEIRPTTISTPGNSNSNSNNNSNNNSVKRLLDHPSIISYKISLSLLQRRKEQFQLLPLSGNNSNNNNDNQMLKNIINENAIIDIEKIIRRENWGSPRTGSPDDSDSNSNRLLEKTIQSMALKLSLSQLLSERKKDMEEMLLNKLIEFFPNSIQEKDNEKEKGGGHSNDINSNSNSNGDKKKSIVNFIENPHNKNGVLYGESNSVTRCRPTYLFLLDAFMDLLYQVQNNYSNTTNINKRKTKIDNENENENEIEFQNEKLKMVNNDVNSNVKVINKNSEEELLLKKEKCCEHGFYRCNECDEIMKRKIKELQDDAVNIQLKNKDDYYQNQMKEMEMQYQNKIQRNLDQVNEMHEEKEKLLRNEIDGLQKSSMKNERHFKERIHDLEEENDQKMIYVKELEDQLKNAQYEIQLSMEKIREKSQMNERKENDLMNNHHQIVENFEKEILEIRAKEKQMLIDERKTWKEKEEVKYSSMNKEMVELKRKIEILSNEKVILSNENQLYKKKQKQKEEEEKEKELKAKKEEEMKEEEEEKKMEDPKEFKSLYEYGFLLSK